jgi:hypothetical protein
MSRRREVAEHNAAKNGLPEEALKLMERAHAQARAERDYFKRVVIPNRMKEIEFEFTELLQEIMPGVVFRFGTQDNEV